ncbi:MAG: hypothetical protein ACRDZ1_11885 [Acidimicrobiia bacterium]
MAAALVLVGCSSGGDGGGAAGDAPRPEPERFAERTSTTAASARIDLSEPIPGGSLHGTPRPPLENTGDDYVAIFESLVGNFRWLTENPDPAVISELYVPGTEDHQGQVSIFQELANKNWHAADDGYYVVSVDVLDTRERFVSLSVTDVMNIEHIVDANGAEVGDGRPRAPKAKAWIVVISSGPSGQWRIADWSPAQEGTVEG